MSARQPLAPLPAITRTLPFPALGGSVTTNRYRTHEIVLCLLVFLALVLALMFATPHSAHASYNHPRRLTKPAKTMVRTFQRDYRHFFGKRLSKRQMRMETSALLKLAYQESSWNPRCVTGSYKGIMQIPARRGWYSRKGRWANVRLNTRKAMSDIADEYGSVRAALAHSHSCGWY